MDCLSILGKLETAMHSLCKLEKCAKVSNLIAADGLHLQQKVDPKISGHDSD